MAKMKGVEHLPTTSLGSEDHHLLTNDRGILACGSSNYGYRYISKYMHKNRLQFPYNIGIVWPKPGHK